MNLPANMPSGKDRVIQRPMSANQLMPLTPRLHRSRWPDQQGDSMEDDLSGVIAEAAVLSGTLAAEMRRHGLLNDEARVAIGNSLKRLAERFDVFDDPSTLAVQLNALANAVLR